jgi:hypothetical protein
MRIVRRLSEVLFRSYISDPPISHSYLTLAAIAALAFIVACVAHEVAGHGGACLVAGSHVTLLSSVYFHCSNGSPSVDAAGPLMNLFVGAVFWSILRTQPRLSAHWRLFLVFAMGFNLFWGAGYFIYSAVMDTGDWAFVLRDLALRPSWIWRGSMGALGVLLYERSVRVVAFYLPPSTPLVTPYLVAGTVSCLAALFFAGPTLPALREAAQESFGAAVGLLLIAYRTRGRVEPPLSTVFVVRSNGWLLTSALVTITFVATLGRGFILGRPALTE